MFKEHTADRQAHGIAAYMPGGKMWTAKSSATSTLRALLQGLGVEMTRAEQLMNVICDECDIAQTSALIGEWEKLLGIPDESIPVAATLGLRRSNVLFKLSIFGTAMAADWVRIAKVLGFTITVGAADGGGDIPYTDWRARFVIVVTVVTTPSLWPWSWPHIWGGMDLTVLKAMLETIKPANCLIVYRDTEA